MRAGVVIDVDFGTPIDSEPGFVRPAVVVAADGVLQAAPRTVLVVPLTSSTTRSLLTEVEVAHGDAASAAQLHLLTTISVQRIVDSADDNVGAGALAQIDRSSPTGSTLRSGQCRWPGPVECDYNDPVNVATSRVSEVGIRELKNGLSKYVDRVRAGEEVIVTDRGRPVARLSPIDAERDRLAELVASGIVRPPAGHTRHRPTRRIESDGPVSDLVGEQRR